MHLPLLSRPQLNDYYCNERKFALCVNRLQTFVHYPPEIGLMKIVMTCYITELIKRRVEILPLVNNTTFLWSTRKIILKLVEPFAGNYDTKRVVAEVHLRRDSCTGIPNPLFPGSGIPDLEYLELLL